MDNNELEEIELKKSKIRKKKLSVLDAVDNLSHLAELDEENKTNSQWLNPQELQDNQEKIRETFNTINQYLQHVYQKERAQLKDPQAQQGIRAIMDLAKEAVQKIEKYTGLFKGALGCEGRVEEYQRLQRFYLSKVVSKVSKDKVPSHLPVDLALSSENQGIEKQALKDLEAVRQDKEYDLFYIYGEDGVSFFNPNLLRHIKMLGSFDENLVRQTGDDLLRELDALLDKDFQDTARYILEESRDVVAIFYKECTKFQKQEGIRYLYQAIMALILASTSHNTDHLSKDKSARHYFSDFQRFVRKALESEELRGALGSHNDLKKESYIRESLKLAFLFCDLIFLHTSHPTGFLNLIQLWQLQKTRLGGSFFSSVSAVDEIISSKLKESPSGPLLKTVRAFEEGRDREGFDPMLQGNAPHQLFTISTENMQTACLHLPSPTHQEYINQVKINAEFLGFLSRPGDHKHFLVNLQDKTSWKEFHRASCLEELSKNAHFNTHLVVITLAMEGDFYHQLGSYASVDAWSDFSSILRQQLLEGESCGFYLPLSYLKNGEVFDSLMKFVHSAFFENKKELDRKERLDFIQTFYLFLIFYILEKEAPDTFSLSCKDGVDKGSSLAAALFGLMHYLSTKKEFTDHESKFFIYALFYPALLVRSRSIQSQGLYRSLSVLEHLQHSFAKNREGILRAAAHFLPDLEMHKLEIFDVA